jgi:type VI protein secretion system component Hcp
MADNALYFLKLVLANGAVEGEATEPKHVGELEIESFHIGGHRSWLEGGASNFSAEDFHFSLRFDKAAPGLMNALQNPKSQAQVKTATLTCMREAQQKYEDYLTWVITSGFISSFDVGGSPHDVIPKVHFSISYDKLEMTYKEVQKGGVVGNKPYNGCWDRTK